MKSSSPPTMSTARLESFSDAVIAILITVMVLELKAPYDASLRGLLGIAPLFLTYMLSFIMLTLMWIAHHYLLHPARQVDRPLLWANSNLLFWMSLVPFATAYLGHNPRVPFAVASYSILQACVIGSFRILRHVVARHPFEDEAQVAHHFAVQRQHLIATTVYLAAAPLAYVSIYLSYGILIGIPLFYFVPGRGLTPWRPPRFK